MEHLFTWYGMSAIGLILILVFLTFAKVMGFVWKLVFAGLVLVGAFFYFRHLFF